MTIETINAVHIIGAALYVLGAHNMHLHIKTIFYLTDNWEGLDHTRLMISTVFWPVYTVILLLQALFSGGQDYE